MILSSISLINPRLTKSKEKNPEFGLPVRKYKDQYVYYDVYLSPKGKGMLAAFFKDFSEIIQFLKVQVKKFGDKFASQRTYNVESYKIG